MEGNIVLLHESNTLPFEECLVTIQKNVNLMVGYKVTCAVYKINLLSH